MSEMKMPNLLHSPAVKIEGDVTLSSGKPVTRHEARRLLMVLGELGDAFELGNAVGNDQHVLADREVDEIVVLGVAVYVEFFRRNACLERAARFVRRGDIDPDVRLGGKTKDRWVRRCLACVTDL